MKPLFKTMTRELVHTSPSEKAPLSFTTICSRGATSRPSSASSLPDSASIIIMSIPHQLPWVKVSEHYLFLYRETCLLIALRVEERSHLVAHLYRKMIAGSAE